MPSNLLMFLQMLAYVIGPGALLWYVGLNFYNNTPMHPLTWACITFINVRHAYSDLQEKDYANAALPVAYTIGSSLVTIMSFRHGEYGITIKEIICISGIVLTVLIGILVPKIDGRWLASATLIIAGLPQAVVLQHTHDLSAWWLWCAGLFAGSMTLAITMHKEPTRHMAQLSFPFAVTTYNLMMLSPVFL